MHFDLALADCTLAGLVNVAQSCLLTGQRPERLGNAHPQIVPYEALGHERRLPGPGDRGRPAVAAFLPGGGPPRWADDPASPRTRPGSNIGGVDSAGGRMMRRRSTAHWQQLLTSIKCRPRQCNRSTRRSHRRRRQLATWCASDRQPRAPRIRVGSAVHWRDQPPPQSGGSALSRRTFRRSAARLAGYEPERIATLRQAQAIA